MYDFFSIPVVHIDNQEQFLVTFSYIFADFRQMGMLVLQKIRETLKSVQAIFDVSSRYRSIPGEHMRNLQNDKSDSGRTHPGTDKIEQCVLPLSTR
jgi:hypothetical protein